MIARNHTGHRVGECRGRAKLTDAQVRDMRAEHERHDTSYARLAIKYGCGKATVRDIVNYYTRASA